MVSQGVLEINTCLLFRSDLKEKFHNLEENLNNLNYLNYLLIDEYKKKLLLKNFHELKFLI